MHRWRELPGLMFPCLMQQIWKDWLSHRLKISFVLQREHATDLCLWPQLPKLIDIVLKFFMSWLVLW
uniref:Uncharacterized protein n=1 Tax=Medicago truncatula TaxID=3880 RepID=I3RZB1_MEDTR|nr:unknown [Medicago truncatula]